MVNYDYQFLESKGFFKNQIEHNEEVKSIIMDIDNYLAYVEVNDNNEVDKLKKLISNKYSKIEIIYFHYQTDNKIKVYRKFGEVKWFYYADTISNPDRKKSKQDKLKKFSPDNVDILFDIKDVMDKFYKDLWIHRLKMAKSITEPLTDNDKLFIAQHFIDRLVFFYFLAQLGIIEVNVNMRGKVSNYKLNKTKTKEFFILLHDSFKDDELHALLNKIFFEGLGNGENANDDGVVSLLIPMSSINITIKVPYLNGGLYRVKEFNGIKETEIKFEGIKNLIETLNQYNWMIGEYAEEDDDSVGSLTPEIMGHVYEKFVVGLENIGEIKLDEIKIDKEVKIGKKKVGAFYTPEEITKYISKNTIIPYLFDKLEVSEQFKDFDDFVDKASTDLLKKALEVLNNIKILDPACGSGHFLVCAGELLFNMKNSICEKLEEVDNSFSREYNTYKEVRNIIVDNLYGVDICDSAVEITKLRLWLWLVSQLKDDSSELEPLPNLEYNIKCGNSLIGWVDEELAQISLNNPYTKEVKCIFKGLMTFCGSKRRENLIKARDLLKSSKLDDYVEAFHILYDIYKTSHGNEATQLKEILEDIRKTIYDCINPAFLKYINEKIKPNHKPKNPPIKFEDFKNLKPFHWRIDFGWIIKEGGFDIIIGNPPYGKLKNLKIPKEEKDKLSKIYKALYDSIGTNIDFYKLFLKRGIDLVKNEGYYSFLMPIMFWGDYDSFNLRKMYYSYNIKKILHFPLDTTMDLFNRVINYEVSIFVLKKIKIDNYSICVYPHISIEDARQMNEINEVLLTKEYIFNNSPLGRLPLFKNSEIEKEILFYLKRYHKFGEYDNRKSLGYIFVGKLDETNHKKYLSKELTGELAVASNHIKDWFVDLIPKCEEKRWIKNGEEFRSKKLNNKIMGAKTVGELMNISPKLICRQMVNRGEKRKLHFAIHYGNEILTNGVRTIILKNLDKEYNKLFLALLNSNILDWYIKTHSLTYNIKPYELEE